MMQSNLLLWTPGCMELLIIIIFFSLPIYLIIRYLFKTGKENRRLRLEVGKLADELQKQNQQLKTGK